MTIESFAEYPEPIDLEAIEAATKRWERQSIVYSTEQRNLTISKLALGILLSWGVLTATVVFTIETKGNLQALGITLTCVLGCIVPLVTAALTNLGVTLRSYKPYKYDLDNPETVLKIRSLLVDNSIKVVAYNFEEYCNDLKGAGVLTDENCKDVKQYIDRYLTISSEYGWFKLSHQDEAIQNDEQLLQEKNNFKSKMTQLRTEWKSYRTNHLANQLPQPVTVSNEETPLNQSAIQYV